MDDHPNNLITTIHSAINGHSSNLWMTIHNLTFVYPSTFRTLNQYKIRHLGHKNHDFKFSVFLKLFWAVKNIVIIST